MYCFPGRDTIGSVELELTNEISYLNRTVRRYKGDIKDLEDSLSEQRRRSDDEAQSLRATVKRLEGDN